MTIEIIKSKAEKLSELRAVINQKEEEAKSIIDVLKAERDQVQTELLEELKKDGLKSIKTENGENYLRASRKGLDITDQVKALFWAKENMCFSVDKKIAQQKISKLDQVPEGFAITETEYISIRKPQEKEE